MLCDVVCLFANRTICYSSFTRGFFSSSGFGSASSMFLITSTVSRGAIANCYGRRGSTQGTISTTGVTSACSPSEESSSDMEEDALDESSEDELTSSSKQ